MSAMHVRILCGAYVPSSPFIDGGCTCDWVEVLDEPHAIVCPGCGQQCAAEFVESTRTTLLTRVVSVIGCRHRAFTFSRRSREPYFSAVETAEEAREAGEAPDRPLES